MSKTTWNPPMWLRAIWSHYQIWKDDDVTVSKTNRRSQIWLISPCRPREPYFYGRRRGSRFVAGLDDRYSTLSSPFGVIFDFSWLETILDIRLWSVSQSEQIIFCVTMEFGERNPFETGKLLVCQIVVSANLNFTLCQRYILSFVAVILKGM